MFFGPVVFPFLIFLFPLALYCLVLAYINRSRRPVLISGLWDCVGLLFGMSGFLLWTLPTLLSGLFDRILAMLPDGDGSVAAMRAWSLSIAYYLLIACGAALLLAVRRHKTVIYNVETEMFGERLVRALASLGLDCMRQSGRWIIAPAEAFITTPAPAPVQVSEAITATPVRAQSAGPPPAKTLHAAPGGPRYAELTVDPFLMFCHVTLHWSSCTSQFRREIEDRLAHTLDDAAPLDNPAAGWFLGFSGLIFGSLTVLAALFVFLRYINRR